MIVKVNLKEYVEKAKEFPLTPNLRKYFTRNPIKRYVIEGFLAQLIKILLILSPSIVLDVGCGEGILFYYFLKHSCSGYLIGVDISLQALKIAKNILGDKADFIQGDATHLPLRKSDVAIAVELLEHVSKPRNVVTELARIAKNVLVAVPYTPLYRLANLCMLKNIKNLGENSDHKHTFTPDKLEALLQIYLGSITIKRAGVWLIASNESY